MTAPRPADPVALPSSTSLRMALVAVALVVSGLFVGTGLYNALDDSWTTTILGCIVADPLDIAAQLACQAPAEQGRAAIAFGAAAVVVLLAGVVVMVAPSVLRRRKRLTQADRRYAPALHAVAQLAAADGTRTPGVLIGPLAMREPFCIGRPGDYRIALPRKLALLGNPPLFEALVRHELAHLAHHDVALSWLARSLWYVLGPLLALPIVVTLVHGEPLLAVDILWRSAALLAVVLLVVRALLRAREYDADLRAAGSAGARQVLDVELSRRPEHRGGWRAALAWHPAPTTRRAVLADPTSAATLSWVDGLTLGFLVALALPIVTGIASAALLGVRAAGLADLVGALAVGPLFGATVGLGLWRHALVARATGRGGTRPVALGVFAGGVLGELVSLAGVGLGVPKPPFAVPLALAGATALIGGLGELRVRRPARGRASIWLPAAALGATAAAALLWAAQQAQFAVQESGWALLTTWLTTPYVVLFPGAAAVVLAVAAGWASRARTSRGAVLVGLCAGVGGGLGLVVYRLVTGPAADDADVLQRFSAVVLGAGLVGALVVALLGLSRGVAGIGAGLLAGPVATLTTGVAYLALNTALGGNSLALAWPLLSTAVPIGLLLTAPAALVGLLPAPPIRSTVAVGAVALIACALASAGVTAARSVLVPGLPGVIPGTSPTGPVDVNHLPMPPIPRDLYLTVVARDLLDRRVAEVSALDRLKTDSPTGIAAAAQIRSDILPLVSELQRAAQSYRFDDPAVQRVHEHALTAAKAHVDGFTLLATAFEKNDKTLFDQAQRLLVRGNAEWEAWAAAAQTL